MNGGAPPLLRLWREGALLAARSLSADHHAIAALQRDADAALLTAPESVTEKRLLPPSGDPHDYQSLGPYWWPNPDTADGLPYVRRDGETNPETETYGDRARMRRVWQSIETLAIAAYVLGRGDCAEQAVVLMRTWFLDPVTRMNPHLEFAQAIPGICAGRDIGIIDTRDLCTLVDAVALLAAVGAWGEGDAVELRGWLSAFLEWLLTSDNGKGESGQHNNHGTWYDVQVVSLAQAVGRVEDVAKPILAASADRRIAAHIALDGSQPHELARTRSFSYSVMNLVGLFHLARLGESVGLDLWGYGPEGGVPLLRRALDFLLPVATEGRPWPYEQIVSADPATLLFPLALRAGADTTALSLPADHRAYLLF